jgi:hypothetical protein
MTSQKAVEDEDAHVRRETGDHALEIPEDNRREIIRPSEFILRAF